MRKKEKIPEEVFTPRSYVVNDSMYVNRSGLEADLLSAFRGSQHLILHGESGTGKTWLYKKVFNENSIQYLPANLANASRFSSLDSEFVNLLDRTNRKLKKGESVENMQSSEFETGFQNPLVGFFARMKMSLSGKKQTQYVITSKEPFEACLEYINKRSKGMPSCMVLENFESIFNNDKLLKNVSDILILLDDERYGQYKVKLLIVGTPNNILTYFSKIASEKPVVNMIYEIEEVIRMSDAQTGELIDRGFRNELNYQVEDINYIKQHVSWITDNIPQRIHEYCLVLSKMASTEKMIRNNMTDVADIKWLKESLSHSYNTISYYMNSRETTVGRRNQALYALGLSVDNEIRYADIESIVRKTFPKSTKGISMNIGQILSELSIGENPILRKTPRGDAYYWVDPKYKMSIRAMLYLEKEEVKKKSISKIDATK